MTPAYYEAIAMKLVPKGHDRSRGDLRRDIAEKLAAEVEKAKAKQIADQFPELASLQASVKDLQTKLQRDRSTWEADLAKAEAAVKKREAAVAALEARLAAVIAAAEAWHLYCKGEGEIDETGKRFDAVTAACSLFFKKEKKK